VFIFKKCNSLVIRLTNPNSAFGVDEFLLLSYITPVLSTDYAAAVSEAMKSFIWPTVILLQRPMFTELNLPWFISTYTCDLLTPIIFAACTGVNSIGSSVMRSPL
jgi:hypothetical protein